MRTADFLQVLDKEYRAWQALLAQVPPERMTVPGAAGQWTVKDIIAHVTWYEQEMVDMIRERTLAGSPLWEEKLDLRNQAIYAQNRDRPLADVLAEAGRVHAELWALCQKLEEGDLDDPARFKDMPLTDKPWQYIVSNTYGHYQEHTPALMEFIQKL